MKDKRLIAGATVSVAWIGVAIWALATQNHPDKLYEWGDFIAGFSAPLAFFWLVLGYMQQGDELRHSTQALRLQAEELKNSVEQQAHLVAVSREQMALQMRAIEEDRAVQKNKAQPIFVARRKTSVDDGRSAYHNIEIFNVGNQATDVNIEFTSPADVHPQRFASFGRESRYTTTLNYVTDADYIAKITYFDADGNYGVAAIDFVISRSTLEISSMRRMN